MPETLRRDLAAYRLQVAQVEIARHPAIAFDLLVFQAASGMLGHASASLTARTCSSRSYATPSRQPGANGSSRAALEAIGKPCRSTG